MGYKVAFLLSDRKNYFGGPIVNMRRLLPELKRRGVTPVALIGYREASSTATWLKEEGIAVETLPLPTDTPAHVRWILEMLNKHRPDVFVADTIHSGGYAIPWVRRMNVPTVVMVRGADARNLEMGRFFFLKKGLFRADALVAVNPLLLKKLSKGALAGESERVKVIPSGPPASDYRARYSGEKLRMVYAGNLLRRPKRIFLVLDLFDRLQQELPEVDLTFLGNGPDKEVLQHEIEVRGLTDKVTIRGPFRGAAYKRELAEHQMLLLFSESEGTPGSVMDGMSCGLVPVCTNFPGVDFLIEHGKNGYIFGGDYAGFRQIVGQLREKAQWEAVSQAALRSFDERLSLAATAAKWQALIENLKPDAPFAPLDLPPRIKLPPVRYHFCNDDRRKDAFNFLLRGVYIVLFRISWRVNRFWKKITKKQ